MSREIEYSKQSNTKCNNRSTKSDVLAYMRVMVVDCGPEFVRAVEKFIK